MPEKIKIAIVEDLTEVAQELKELFNEQPDMCCTQLYGNAEDALIFLEKFPVDLVVVDIGLPKASGIELMLKLKEKCPNTLFCMFTVFEDDDKIFNSLKAGAKGYILKNAAPDVIVSSVRELHHGGSPMSPAVARKIIDSFAKLIPDQRSTEKLPLSQRESQLLELLSKGLLYKEIGVEMGITTGTVKQHIHKIYDKLQVSNRTEAINLYNR